MRLLCRLPPHAIEIVDIDARHIISTARSCDCEAIICNCCRQRFKRWRVCTSKEREEREKALRCVSSRRIDEEG